MRSFVENKSAKEKDCYDAKSAVEESGKYGGGGREEWPFTFANAVGKTFYKGKV